MFAWTSDVHPFVCQPCALSTLKLDLCTRSSPLTTKVHGKHCPNLPSNISLVERTRAQKSLPRYCPLLTCFCLDLPCCASLEMTVCFPSSGAASSGLVIPRERFLVAGGILPQMSSSEDSLKCESMSGLMGFRPGYRWWWGKAHWAQGQRGHEECEGHEGVGTRQCRVGTAGPNSGATNIISPPDMGWGLWMSNIRAWPKSSTLILPLEVIIMLSDLKSLCTTPDMRVRIRGPGTHT